MSQTPRVRAAELPDVPAILGLIADLAEYERAADQAKASAAQIRQALFPPDGEPRSHALVACVDGPQGEQVVGFAVWYLTFSTWQGRAGIWLEDLFVQPAHRGTGLGLQLLRSLAQTVHTRDYGRLEWWVLNWNTTAIDFYEALGARPQSEWTVYRLEGAALARLALDASGPAPKLPET